MAIVSVYTCLVLLTHMCTSSSAELVRMTVVLKHPVLEEGLSFTAMSLSDPKHANYGQTLSNTEIEQLASDPVAQKALGDWALPVLSRSQVRWGIGGDVAFLRGTPTQIRLLNASIPAALAEQFIAAIFYETAPLTASSSEAPDVPLGTWNEQTESRGAAAYGDCSMFSKDRSGCFNSTPSSIAQMYNISGVHVRANSSVRQAVGAIPYAQSNVTAKFDSKALARFFRDYVPGADADSAQVDRVLPSDIVGHKVYKETMLDVEYVMGIAPGVRTDLWYYPVDTITDWCHGMVLWVDDILSSPDPPSVVSISYGWQNNLSISFVGCDQSQQIAVDNAFMKLAAKRISVLAASGDSGSGTFAPKQPLFGSFPASSTWVTAVGSTRLANEKLGGPEIASTTFGSGGGFSWDLPIPDWQASAVSGYFLSANASELPNPQYYNRGGRATPDVSVIGEGLEIVEREFLFYTYTTIDGTSASTPIFAGIVSLLNEARAQKGCASLGFLNPLFYLHPEGFNDITIGNNRRPKVVGAEGWDCAKGWDPVTGLGTPKFQTLLDIALSNCH